MRSGQQSAGSKDVLSPAGAYRGGDAVCVQIVADALHPALVGTVELYARYLVEAYQVDAALQSVEQLYDFADMRRAVIDTPEDDILEREPALMAEIISAEQVHDICDGVGFLGRHHLSALLGDGRVHADGQMALALIEESFQPLLQSYTTHCNPFRTPCISVVGSHNLCHLKHIVQIVERFTLSHKNDIGQSVTFRQRINLIENVCHGQAPFESLFARLAEKAVHLASYLRRDAQRGALFFRYEHRLDDCALESSPPLFDGAVDRLLAFGRSSSADAVLPRQLVAVGFRQVCHLVNLRHMTAVEPFGNLFRGKSRHAEVADNLLQLSKRHPQTWYFLTVHSLILLF